MIEDDILGQRDLEAAQGDRTGAGERCEQHVIGAGLACGELQRKGRRAAAGNAELETAQRELARHDVFLQLNDAILEPKPQDQTLVTLRYLEQKSYAEIATIIGKRTGAVTM